MTPTAAAGVAVVIALAQFVGKIIPDDATGTLGTVRKIAKVIGFWVENRK